MPVVNASITFAKITKSGERIEMQEALRFIFEHDMDWWPAFPAINSMENISAEPEIWMQELSFLHKAFKPSNLVHHMHIVEREEGENFAYVKTVAESVEGPPLSYIAYYKLEDLGDSYRFTLEGKLNLPGFLEKPFSFLVEKVSGLALGKLKTLMESGEYKNILDQSEI